MNDHAVRKAFFRKRARRFGKEHNSLLVEELSLGSGSPRIDIAILSDRLVGFEIKSDQDSLYRLQDQTRAYSQVFDRLTLLVSYRHAYEAFKIIPEWWGVKLLRSGRQGAVYFDDARSPARNPNDNTQGVLRLLWRTEVLQILDEYTESSFPRKAPRAVLCEELLSLLDSRTIHRHALAKIKSRLRPVAA